MSENLLTFRHGRRLKLLTNMNPKKPKRLKSRPAGISLEPAITDAARAIAVREGYGSLSAYVRHVLVQLICDHEDDRVAAGYTHASVTTMAKAITKAVNLPNSR